MEKFTIHSGFFFGAGSMYKWQDDGFHIYGIGLNLSLLLNNDYLEITVRSKDKNNWINVGPYILDCAEALKFISRYDSVKKIKGNQVGIISKTLLKTKSEA